MERLVNGSLQELKKRQSQKHSGAGRKAADALKAERQNLESRRARIIEAIEAGGSDLLILTQRLRLLQSELGRVDRAAVDDR